MDARRNEEGLAMASPNQVIEKADRVLIVASGPSARALDLNLVARAREAGVYVLAVNRAWDWCEHIDGWFTLDPDHKLLPYIIDDDTDVTRYVAVPDDYGSPRAEISYHRNMPIFPDVVYLTRLASKEWLGQKYGLSTDPHSIHTGNSAYGALGVAFHMGAKKIGLIGVDVSSRLGYAYHNGRPNHLLMHMSKLFKSAVPQLESAGTAVQNGSPASKVKCFVRRHPNPVVKWLME